MPAPESKSVLRSIRIRRSLQQTLERDAEAKGISVNSLVSAVLTRYAEWDRFAEKFGFVTITKSGHQMMMDAIPEGQIDELAERLGAQNPREVTLFWFKQLGLEPFLGYLMASSRYGRSFEVEVERAGAEVTLLFHHDYGPSYSRFLLHFFSKAIPSIVGATPRSQVGRNSVVIKFRAPPHPPTAAD